MLRMSNPDEESRQLQELIESDEAIRKRHERFIAEMEFKQQLIEIRRAEALTQAEIGKRSGLSQQAVSRLEKGNGATIETVIRYLDSMGYKLGIQKI